MKDKLLAEIQKCESRLEVLRELLHDVGGAPAKKLGRPRKVVAALEAAPRKKPGPKPKAKVVKAAKAAKPDKPKAQAPRKEKGKRARLVYPGVDVVLAALSEPKGVSAIAKDIKFEQKLVSVVVKKLVEDGKVAQEGGGRWTTLSPALCAAR